ncbi:MAG: 50S ribosomal protein L11 methyltransferase, partial [Puniceicoccales bacterium]|nr:50S ribosomal protein L11 methyltransferase [Puniceicoccales bacterium]
MTTADTTFLTLDASAYLGLAHAPATVRAQLNIALTRHTFLPEAADLLRDWVATVATPVFKLIRLREGTKRAFCSIGTGAGLDAIAAIETLGATRIGITDVHANVVEAAARNITSNVLPTHEVELEA